MNPDGLVYGIADRKTFFVFDAKKKEIIYKYDLMPEFGVTTSGQSPRIFVHGANKEIYILLRKGIAEVEAKTFKIKLLATLPIPIDGGGDFHDGRVYFLGGSHLYSYEIPW
jgi:hypothetical protein